MVFETLLRGTDHIFVVANVMLLPMVALVM